MFFSLQTIDCEKYSKYYSAFVFSKLQPVLVKKNKAPKPLKSSSTLFINRY